MPHLCKAAGWIQDFSDWAATAGLSESEKQVGLGRTDKRPKAKLLLKFPLLRTIRRIIQ